MKQIVFCILIIILLPSCIASRLRQPKLIGYIYDSSTKQPIENCMVGKSYANAEGYYELKEKRYLRIEFPGLEIPPIMINELVVKKGYITDTIMLFSRGGARKNAHWKMDTIFLQPE